MNWRVLKPIIFVIISITLAVVYQNCGGVKFSTLPSVPPPEGPKGGISSVKPALAIRQTQCIICHASIQGNIVTDFRFGTNGSGEILKADNIGGSSRGTGTGEYAFFIEPNQYGSRLFWATNYINGTIFAPRASFMQASFDDLQAGITYSKSNQSYVGYTGQVLQANAPAGESVRTVAGYLNTILNYRTSNYQTALANYSGFAKPVGSVHDANIREVKSVNISSPSSAEITALSAGARSQYIKNAGGLDLSGLVDEGNHFRVDNTSGEFVCDGDLILNDILFLKNLKVRTRGGCRIYVTKTVFIESSQNGFITNRNVFDFIDDSGQNKHNLQITSSRAILLGLGQCSGTTNTVSHPSSPRFTTSDSVYLDYQVIVNSGKPIPQDAYACGDRNNPKRIAHVERTLLNAPRVDSRFTGHFSGVIVADLMLSALGKFNYQYDLVFDVASILPQGEIGKNIFSIEDCNDAQGADQSRVVDSKFRSCHPN